MGGGSSKEMADTFVVKPQSQHKSTLIFLHGLGDTGQGWSMSFEQLKLQNIKCICPTAPIQPVTLNAGFRMPSWFDIASLSPDADEDAEGIKKASDALKELIASEEKLVSSENIYVGGFSQGGAVALYTAFTIDKPLAGVIGLSTWMPLHKQFDPQAVKMNRDIPVFQAHGTLDPLVPKLWGDITGELLKKITVKHTYKTYPIMHSSCQEEMDDVKSFLESLAKD